MWSEALLARIKARNSGLSPTDSDEGIDVPSNDSDTSSDDGENDDDDDDGLVDLEDLGRVMKNAVKKKEPSDSAPKEMVTPLLRKSLTKQGYKIIGSHSGKIKTKV